MTKTDVERRTVEIRARKGEDKEQHLLEDSLYFDVLKAIANGDCDDPAGLARMALRTMKIRFRRGVI